MKVLVYDNKDGKKLLMMLQLLFQNVQYEIVSSFEEAIEQYEPSAFKYIFIDYSEDEGKNIVRKIMELNPDEKITTLNTEYACYNKHNCIDCNNRMLIKPISLNQLSQYLSLEECNCTNLNITEFKLERIQKSIQNIHPNFKFEFDKKNFLFSSCSFTSSVLETFIALFKENNVTYNIINDREIALVK